MEAHLSSYEWLVGDTLKIADIALYAYTHVAAEGGFILQSRPSVRAWVARCADLMPAEPDV